MPTEYVKNWFLRADEDLAVIEAIINEDNISPNSICFHAQQAGEKYLKGFLAHHALHVRKIHSFKTLIIECINIDQDFKELLESASTLDQFYIESHYPDDYVEFSLAQAREGYVEAKKIKELILLKVL